MIPETDQSNYLTLQRRHYETEDAVSFFFQTADKTPLLFKPGQFINIGVMIEGKTEYRAYSISSLPHNPEIQLTIKRVAGGRVSNWMIDHLMIGERVSIHGIAGNFTIVDVPLKQHLIFISAGCGITPIMSMARHILTTHHAAIAKISFIHCARDADNLIYESDIALLAQRYPQFKATFYLDNKNTREESIDSHRQGPIDQHKLQEHLNATGQANSAIFLCGPTGFMSMVEAQLMALKFDMAYFQHESFTPEAALDITTTSNATHKISVPAFDIEIEAKAGEILLEVLQNHDVPIIAACRSGICGSCKCQVSAGSIEAHHNAVENGLFTEEEVKAGYTLACSSTINNAATIEL